MTKQSVFKLAAAVIMIAAAAFMLARYIMQTRSGPRYADLMFLCMNHDELEPFTIQANELGKLKQQRKSLACPICGSYDDVRTAKPCPECDGPIVTGPHGITAATCPHCDAVLRTGREDFFHAGQH